MKYIFCLLLYITNNAFSQQSVFHSLNQTSTVASTTKWVFVSSISQASNTSVANRDARCNTDAAAAGLSGSGTYKAWVANGGSNNVPNPGNTIVFKKVDGVTAAANWTALTSGTLASAINKFANGTSANAYFVWTGIKADGTVSGSDCSSWSSWNANGTSGFTGNTDGMWTNYNMNEICGSQSGVFDCSGANSQYIGTNPADDCSCWPGLSIATCSASFNSVYSKDCPGNVACGGPCVLSSWCRCCLQTGTTTTYTSYRHYCFQQ